MSIGFTPGYQYIYFVIFCLLRQKKSVIFQFFFLFQFSFKIFFIKCECEKCAYAQTNIFISRYSDLDITNVFCTSHEVIHLCINTYWKYADRKSWMLYHSKHCCYYTKEWFQSRESKTGNIFAIILSYLDESDQPIVIRCYRFAL